MMRSRLGVGKYQEGVLNVRFLNQPRRCNTRLGKRAAKYLWRVENTDYGKLSCLVPVWNRKLKKWVLKSRLKD
jgi:hypothetical protein